MTPNGTKEGSGTPPADAREQGSVSNQVQPVAAEPKEEIGHASDTARIFISHKAEDHGIAVALRDILKDCDDEDHPKLTFNICEEIPGGQKWYEWIRENLRTSNLLILIYTDPSRNWDWCLYETGLFDDLNGVYHRRIICLHSSKTMPPGPLAEFQSFAATTDRIREFVNQFLIGKELLNLEEPVAKWLRKSPERLKKVVEEIRKLIDREAQRISYYCKHIFIEVENPDQTMTARAIPSNAKVKSDDASLEIFKKKQREELTWQELKDKAEENEDRRWMDELAKAMRQVAKGDIPDPIQAGFPSLQGDKTYHPILYRADRMVGGNIEYKILFNEDVTWRLKGVPTKIGSLLTYLVMATRFKYEVIDAFRNAYTRCGGAALDKTTFASTRQGILNIISEARSRGTIDRARESLIDLFHDQEKKEVNEMLGRWDKLGGDLLVKLQEQDTETVYGYMEELKEINKNFLIVGMKRFLELVVNE